MIKTSLEKKRKKKCLLKTVNKSEVIILNINDAFDYAKSTQKEWEDFARH